MSKYTLKSLIVALVMLVPVLAFALPGAHDPTLGAVSSCDSCHRPPNTMGNSVGNYSTNLCLRCHGGSAAAIAFYGNASYASQKAFMTEDYADPLKTGGPARGSALQTSHKWFGVVAVPSAGAVAPIDASVNGLNKSGNFVSAGMFCARCHNVHGTSGAQSTKSPYLRYPNDSDQLCLNCHRPRDTKDHKLGTHPVNVFYSSARNANIAANSPTRTKFRTDPVASLATTSPGKFSKVKLVNGKVVCSTCHKTHNSDSRTSTFDPYSTTHTFGQLSSSTGMLLRVSAYGKSPQTEGDMNICSNCHVTRNHNTNLKLGKPAVQCMDCHSGHVEYDAAFPGEAKNVNLVRRYLQYTTAGRIGKRILYRSDTNKEFYNATGNGVCQVCHRPPVDHYTGDTYGGVFPKAAMTGCAGCHNHEQTTGAFHYGTGGSCSNACHGLPPTTTASPGPTGPVAGFTRLNEGLSPHLSHAAGGGPNANDYDCIVCHNGYTMPRDNANTVIEVFVTPTWNPPMAPPGVAASYNSTSFECSNVYCHSNGRGIWKAGMSPILWKDQRGTIIGQPTECTTCHDDPNSSVAHQRHVIDRGYGCVVCHAATVSSNTTLLASAKISGGTHASGVKDVLFSQTGASVGTTCANIACHSNGKGAAPNITPTWGTATSGQCGACHWTQTSSTVLASGSHTKHFLEIGGTDPLVVCARCHTYASEVASTHADGIIQVTTGCSTCHASPYSSSFQTPTWGTSSSGCGSCHNGVGSFTGTGAGPNTAGHNKHMAISGANCGQCHAGANAGVTGGNNHGSTKIDVTQGYLTSPVTKHAAGSGYSTCSAASCHSNPYGSSYISTPTWGVVGGCVSCHIGVGAFTGTGSAPVTGSHTTHMAQGGINCDDCHAGATISSYPAASHYDNNIDVIGGYTANVTKHSAGSGYFKCSTAVCHANPYSSASVITPTWGTSSLGGCDACHTGVGAFTGTGSAPATGSHTRHMAIVSAACNQCHTNATTTSYSDAAHRDGNIDVIGSFVADVTKHSAGSGYTTCSAASCHANPYSSSYITAPTWGSASGCVACHTGVGAFTGTGSSPNTGSHTKHMALGGSACNQCHANAIITLYNDAAHTDGNIDVTGGYTANLAKHSAGSGYTTCSTASCHSSSYGTSPVVSPTWGVAAGCAACHAGVGAFTGTGSSPNTGSHTKHMALGGSACNQCHANATITSYTDAAHTDGNIDVIGSLVANVTKHSANSGYTTCNAASCHASSYGSAYVTTPTWGVAAGCVSCHSGVGAFTGTGSSPNTGSHTKHMAIVGAACNQCHANSTITSYTDAAHTDGNVDVIGSLVANITKHSAGSGYTTCNAASCHANPYASSYITTPVWGAASNCVACHTGVGAFTGAGSSPNTGAHTRHMGLAGAACNQCHANTTITLYNDAAHTDGNIDVTGGYTANVTKHAAGSGYTSSCSTSTCHGASSPTWGISTTNDQCTKCHGVGTGTVNDANRYLIAPPINLAGTTGTLTGTGEVSNNNKVGAHQTHMRYFNGFSNYSTVTYRCETCHGTLPNAAAVITHADGLSTPQGKFQNLANKWGAGTPTYNSGTTTCLNTYCHNPSSYGTVSQAGTKPAPSWVDATYIADGGKSLANCQVCHLVPGSSGFSAQGSHSAMITDTSANQCNGCHGHNGDTSGLLGERHLDGKRPGAVGGSCDGCHDYDTVGSSYAGGKWTGGTWGKAGTNYGQTAVAEGWGAHAKHVNYIKSRSGIAVALTAAGQSFGAGQPAAVCGVCHSNSAGDHNMGGSTTDAGGRTISFGNSAFTVNGTTLRFGASNPIYNGTSGVSSATDAKTCSNISCHYFTTPLWSTY